MSGVPKSRSRIACSASRVVAAVNGPAFGVGTSMTLPMDARFAAPDATFGFVFTKLGIVPEGCSSLFLPRLVGIPTALEWMMSGKRVSAADAREGVAAFRERRAPAFTMRVPDDLPAAYPWWEPDDWSS